MWIVDWWKMIWLLIQGQRSGGSVGTEWVETCCKKGRGFTGDWQSTCPSPTYLRRLLFMGRWTARRTWMTQLGRVRMRTCFSSKQEAGCKASPGEGSALVDLDIFLIHKKKLQVWPLPLHRAQQCFNRVQHRGERWVWGMMREGLGIGFEEFFQISLFWLNIQIRGPTYK